jgi:hypothetical protein
MARPFLPSLLFAMTATTLGAWEVVPSGDRKNEGPVSAETPSFRDAVRPILEAKCFRCHSSKTPKAELDLSTAQGLRKGGESGPVIVEGKPDQSALYEKIHSGEMPPGKKNHLEVKEIEIVRQWIAAGADTGSEKVKASAAEITQHDALPILLRHCTHCHGVRQKEGNLDLTSRAAMLRGGKSGPAVVPGKPDESLVIKRIRLGQMPPPTLLVEGSVKPVDAAERETLEKWISAGAPEIAIEPDIATTTPDPMVTDKDREFWAFQSPRRVTIPSVTKTDRARNPIDAFVSQKRKAKGLEPAPEADRLTLLRRATFDLTGLPPTPEDVQEFLDDTAPDAYERLIDRLLASPRYGERWGRYWLDLAGYADSEGKREQDLPRPYAWRYRDYVIKSFNRDKPYSRFLMEQLAGDELANYENAPEITEELADNLVATGFLRMAPDATWANITGYATDRVEVIADEIDVLGSAVMGLTMKCARCHSHKFDPIPHRDYYRLIAVFKGAYDEYDWLKPDVRQGLGPISLDIRGGRLLPQVMTTERRAWELNEQRITREIQALRSQSAQADARISALEAQRQEAPKIQALWDRGVPSPTYIYRRGDSTTPGRLVGPGVPSVLTDGKTPLEVKPPWPGAKQTGRRLAFAKWVTRTDHPLTARVVVNRIWKHHFGSGIVKTLANFGKAGTPPTHPELLDWLANELVDRGWSLNAIHRLIMTSSTYRQSSGITGEQERIDSDNALYSRMPLVRLDAEALYDTLLMISGRLNERRFGPADPVEVRPDGLVTPSGTSQGYRRMIYVRKTRKQVPTHLENFDYPQMNPNCIERRDSIVALQALELMNAGMIQNLADHFAQRVLREAGGDRARQVDRVYMIAMSRHPSEIERTIGVDALEQLARQWSKTAAGPGQRDPESAARQSLATYCHAIMNSAALLYID